MFGTHELIIPSLDEDVETNIVESIESNNINRNKQENKNELNYDKEQVNKILQDNERRRMERHGKKYKMSPEEYKQMKIDLKKGPYLYRPSQMSNDGDGSDRVVVIVASVLIITMFVYCILNLCRIPLVILFPYFVLMFVLMAGSYYKAVTTPPMKCVGYEPDCTEQEKQEAIERETFGKEHKFKVVDIGYPARYCYHCKGFKCERAYHCKKCKACVLRRDHHCPWIGQCVGQHNYRYFLQFLIYLPWNCINGIIIVLWSLFKDFKDTVHEPHPASIIFSMISLFTLIILFGFGFSVMMLTITYFHTALINVTSMEDVEHDRYESLSHHKAPSLPSYDKGMFNNWKEYMGETFWSWVSPFASDGRENLNNDVTISLEEIQMS